MIGKPYFRLTSILLALALVLSLTACGNKDSGNSANNGDTTTTSDVEDTTTTSDTEGYAAKLFDTSYIHTIDIAISDDDLSDLKENPLEKTKYEVNITIDGETIESVSFATKGNTSLSSVAQNAESDRYSFKVNFGKYNEGQTYYGLNSVYDLLLSEYFESGKFESEMDALYEMLYPYVEKDPSAFYTLDEFITAYETLKQFCLLRAESIRLQLGGILSTKSDEQDASKYVDASDINIRSMGSLGGGREDGAGAPGNMPKGNFPTMPGQEGNSESTAPVDSGE